MTDYPRPHVYKVERLGGPPVRLHTHGVVEGPKVVPQFGTTGLVTGRTIVWKPTEIREETEREGEG